MITSDQVSTARRLLGWTLIRLSSCSRVSDVTIEKFEKRKFCSQTSLEAIQRALEIGGVEFTNVGQPGVRMKKAPT
jgi:hypothetical protein